MKKIVFLSLLVSFFVATSGVLAHGGQGTTDTRLNLFEDPKKSSSLADGIMIGKLTISHNVVAALMEEFGVEVPEASDDLLVAVKKSEKKIFELFKTSDQYMIQNDAKVCLKDSFVIDDIKPEEFEGYGLKISFQVDCGGPIGMLRVKNGLFFNLNDEHYNFINVAGLGDMLIEGGMLSAQSNVVDVEVGTPSAKPETFGEFKKKVGEQTNSNDGMGKSFGVGVGALLVGLASGGWLGFRAGKKG